MIRLAALALWASLSSIAGAEPLQVRPIEMPTAPAARFAGAVAVTPPFEGFGGVSGLERLADGRFAAVSDRGRWLTFDAVVEEGRLTGLSDVAVTPILTTKGVPVAGRVADAEDIAPGLWLSFEGAHRLARYDEPGGPALELLRHPDWKSLKSNGGLEALARDADGRLWALPERSAGHGQPFPVWVWNGADWTPLRLPRNGRYALTAAAFGPDGALYLIERDFSLFTGFLTRLRRVTWAGDTVTSDEILIDFRRAGDNLEALTIWRDEAGRDLALLASDDNFNPLQRNIFALYELVR